MVFPSVEFAVFFPVVLGLSWLLMPRPRAWKVFILAASYVFYAAADVRFCALLAAVTVVNQAGAVLVGRAAGHGAKNAIVAVTVGLDLLALGFFKYYGFFVSNVDERAARRRARRPRRRCSRSRCRSACRSSRSRRSATSSTSAAASATARPRSTSRSTSRSSRTSSPARSSVRASSSRSCATPRDPRDVAVGAGVMLITSG